MTKGQIRSRVSPRIDICSVEPCWRFTALLKLSVYNNDRASADQKLNM